MANSGQTESAPSAKQLVFLTMMATAVAVIVFLCGVLVGRGVPLRRGDVSGALDALPRGGDPIGIGVPELPPNPNDSSDSLLDGLSYFERLSETDVGTETEPTGRSLEAVLPDISQSSVLPEADPVPEVLASGETSATVGEGFVVQVTAFPVGEEAEGVAVRLAAKGYPAFVVPPVLEASTTVYGVRVGPYADRAEADMVRRRLEAEERLTPRVVQQ